MKNFFNITKPYEFDFNDVRCFLTLINVILIMVFGRSVAFFGLAIAFFGVVRDMICKERRLNNTIQHSLNVILNLYFISLL